VALHLTTFSRLVPIIDEYASLAPQISAGQTLLSFNFSENGLDEAGRPLTTFARPFKHVSGYIAAMSLAVDLRNYEAEVGQFPLRFRPEADPFVHIDHMRRSGLPAFGFSRYQERTGLAVDNVVVLYGGRVPPGHPLAKNLHRQLGHGYRLVATSKPAGLASLYQRTEP
jgi:hypothetical protein